MTNARLFAVIAVTALLSWSVVASVTLAYPALADTPRTAVCTDGIKPEGKLPPYSDPAHTNVLKAPMEAWMTEQLAAGRTDFGLVPAYGTTSLLFCAW